MAEIIKARKLFDIRNFTNPDYEAIFALKSYFVNIGTASLVSGVATISHPRIQGNSVCVVNYTVIGGTIGQGFKIATSAGSITITSLTSTGTTQTLDTSSINYIIIF